ncbi:MAG: hypothetical protein V4515_01630 [Chloroflexota bacterium]
MTSERFYKWSTYALIAWASHWLVRDFIFAFTHGTQEAAMNRSLLGLNITQYGSLWTAVSALGLIGVAGVYVEAAPRLGRLGTVGFVVSALGFAMSFVAHVMQNWILNPNVYFHSPVVYGGWLLSIAAVFVMTAGLIVAGIGVMRSNALPRERSLLLIIGLISLPTALLHPLVVGGSDGSLATELVYGSLSVPYGLCWLRMGLLRLAAARGTPASRW